jgi:hypothetical protein
MTDTVKIDFNEVMLGASEIQSHRLDTGVRSRRNKGRSSFERAEVIEVEYSRSIDLAWSGLYRK